MAESFSLEVIEQRVQEASRWIQRLRDEIGRVVIGQRYLVDRLLIGLLADGHVLLEGVPGLAKTLSVRTLATTLQASFARLQFTPDLLPADILGTLIYNPKTGEFSTKRGPIFAQIVLADEINRAPAKVQSALLEAMQERQVTIGDTTYPLPVPFLVLATENPIDQEGTYPLPEAQVDRFMLKLNVGYPTREEERTILDAQARTGAKPTASPVVTPEEILAARAVVNDLYLDDKLKDYIVDLIFASRYPKEAGLADLEDFIQFGASPRATIALTLASKAHAFLQGRGYVTPQDIKAIGPDVLRHRLIVSYEAEAEGLSSDDLVKKIFDAVPVP
ncbi:MAG: MoxR family ATPase [Verrucomicrobiota bacterium JB022]|nr:MoxR family ATPase [Verrucomicrobiota bacterium JB022]